MNESASELFIRAPADGAKVLFKHNLFPSRGDTHLFSNVRKMSINTIVENEEEPMIGSHS